MSITMINVGQPHPLWTPQADAGLCSSDDLGLFVLGLPNPTKTQIGEFQGPGRFGLMKHRRISVLTINFGSTISRTAAYHASLVDRDETPTLARAGEHKLLTFCLVDAPTGETISLRTSTISPHLTAMFQRHVCQQFVNPISMSDVHRDFKDFLLTYPTEQAFIRASTWCQLGD